MRDDQVDVVDESRDEVLGQDRLPVRVNGSLSVSDEANALLHDLRGTSQRFTIRYERKETHSTNIQVVREARVLARNPDRT